MITEMSADFQVKRTCSAIRRMSEGGHITLSDGHRLAMGEDMSIGYLYSSSEGDKVSPLSSLTFKELNDILNKEQIFFFI